MTTTFTPEIGERTTTREVTTTRKGVLNYPEVGTRIRATLGQTVIVGKVYEGVGGYELISVRADGSNDCYDHTVQFHLWTGAGWTFEILDEPTPPKPHTWGDTLAEVARVSANYGEVSA